MVGVTASGFSPNVEVDISFQAGNLATVTTDAAGHLSTTVRIPPAWPFHGRFPIDATEHNTGKYAEEFFEVP
jgi:hypothetical protein